MTPEKRQELIEKITRRAIPNSMVLRALSSPLKASAIVSMRKLGWQQSIACSLVWGDHFHGAIPEAVTSLIWRYGFYEAKTSLFLLKYLNDDSVFLDVGAHFGYFTLLGSRLVRSGGRVLSIEAMPRTFAMLEGNLKANGIGNVKPLNIAGADADGTLTFRDFGIVNSSLNSMFAPRGALQDTKRAGVEVVVPGRRLDEIVEAELARPVNVIKVDAESSEESVLIGLAATLLRDKPIVIVELGGGDADEDARAGRIAELMSRYGHRPFAFDGVALHEIQSLDRLPYVNAFFLTDEHVATMQIGADFQATDNSV